MAHFNYLAQDAQNKQSRGSLEAKDINEAKAKIRQMGLYIVEISPESVLAARFGGSGVKNKDVAIFSHQFAVMIASGIPLIRALKALADETPNKKFQGIIEKVRFDVENGASLSVALGKYPQVFSNFFVSLIKTGEAAGALHTVLNRLSTHLENQEDLRRKVSSSFAYPVIVGFVALAVVTFLLIFIVPVFQKVYKTLKINLPGPTVLLINLSNILVNFWWLVLILIGLIIFVYAYIRNNDAFRLIMDKLKLRIPLFGQLNRKVAVSHFARTLSTLSASGVPLGVSFGIAQEVVDNKVIASIIYAMQADVSQGKSLTEALKKGRIFPSIAIQMVSVGEESGNLNAMLDKCADFLDEDIDALIKSLVIKLEPILTVFLAVLVGFIAMAIYLPMFDIIKQVSK